MKKLLSFLFLLLAIPSILLAQLEYKPMVAGVTATGDTIYFTKFVVLQHGMALRSSSTNASILTSSSLGIYAPTMSDTGLVVSDNAANQSTRPSAYFNQTAKILQDSSSNTGTAATMSTKYIAVKFVASGNHTMGDYRIKIKESANITNYTGVMTGYIYASDGGSPAKPTGSALATGNSIRFGTITTSYQELSVGTSYNLVSGTTYWLVLKYNSTPSGGNILFDSDISTNIGATSTNGSTWTNTNVGLYYKICGLTGIANYNFSTNNVGVYGYSTNSYGISGNSINSYGIRGNSTNNAGIYGYSNPSSTSSSFTVARFDRTTSGTAANGIGINTDYYIEDAGGTSELAGRDSYIFTNAGASSEASSRGFWTRTGGAAIVESATLTNTSFSTIGTVSAATGFTTYTLNYKGIQAATYDAVAGDTWWSLAGTGVDTLWTSIDGTNATYVLGATRVAKH